MKLIAKWSKWSGWTSRMDYDVRVRALKLGSITIAEHRHFETHGTHIWGTGSYHLIEIGREQSTRVYRTSRAALKRLRILTK